MTQLRNGAVITWIGFRRIFNDRLAMFFVIVFPFMIIFFVGTSFFAEEQRLPVGIVMGDEGRFATEIRDELGDARIVQLDFYDDASTMRSELLREVVVAGVVVPPGYTDALEAGEAQEIGFIFNIQRNSLAQTVRALLDGIVANQGAEVKAARFATESAGGDFEEHLRVARSLNASDEGGIPITQEAIGVESSDSQADSPIPFGFTYPVAATMILFVFINTLSGAQNVIANRALGISTRILGSPTKPRTLVLGEAGARFAIAVFQSVVVVAVGVAFFDIDLGDPLAVGVLVVAFAFVATGGALFLGTITRSQQFASALAPSLGIGMGMLGGCMWPLEIVGDTMQTIGHITPHAWAMDAFIDLFGRGGNLADIVPELAVLAGFAVALLTISSLRMRRGLEA